ncbi:protein phosphatase 1L [Sabethes cyaneus]|uniref:protein phosphatase 1L n=1 Tax=Sabethes cyaneus TaxID=53552 RepID=UPI00237DE06E|nr:protein phosphatase 1L [Sabethes cyaneus]XP_053692978.1 protein phosphatase 1L [Sabethes cyaneus]XP_053692979.1 protein phosphatase 1L [Sabethes cyaneus]
MEDELEDKILYQTFFKSHMKLLSKFAVGVSPFNSSVGYVWKVMRVYLLKPEVLIAGLLIFVFVLYLQASEVWSRGFIGRISSSFGLTKGTRAGKLALLTSAAEKHSWEEKGGNSAVYAVQGRRPRMEDRFVIDENLNDTGISLYAIFDGHGGEFAAEYAKAVLVKNLNLKLTQSCTVAAGKPAPPVAPDNIDLKASDCTDDDTDGEINERHKLNSGPAVAATAAPGSPAGSSLTQRRQSFRKSKTEDVIDKSSASNSNANGNNNNNPNSANQKLETDLLNKYMGNASPARQITKESLLNGTSGQQTNQKPKTYDAKCYVSNGSINYGKIITDEVLAADYDLVEMAKRVSNFAGTTALIAVMHNTKLIVANVGDSRGVMCDLKGNAIPLSFDHKPQQVREQKRIADAGGFISFKGVWRVAGILATSRALGDFPLKEKNLVIAEPDILSFDLVYHRPMFLILASDGLWDTFSNEEAVAFIRERLDEPHFGAKSITLQSYNRGSVDNITVLVIVFKNGRYEIGSSNGN